MILRLLASLLIFALPASAQTEGQSAPAAPPAAADPAPAFAPVPPSQAVPAATLSPEEQGDLLMAQKRYQAAVDAYKKGSQSSAMLWNKMGIAYQMFLSEDNALRCYKQSLKLDPKNAHVLNNIGTIYDARRDYGAAEKMYRKALKLTPKAPLILKNLGTNLLSQHKYKKAWAAYNAALAIDPAIFERANSGLRSQSAASAKERGAMNYFMAKSYARAGRFDQAIDSLRMALNQGYVTPKKILDDKEFGPLRGLPAFGELLKAQAEPR